MPRDLSIQTTAGGTNITPSNAAPNIAYNQGGTTTDGYVTPAQIESLAGNIDLQTTRNLTENDQLTLGAQSLTLEAGNNLTISPSAGLQMSGNVSLIAAASNIPGYDPSGALSINSTLTTTSAVTLSAGTSGISENGGAITAGTLSVGSSGVVQLTGANNMVATLGAVTAGSDFALVDGQALTVNSAIDLGSHALSLTTRGSVNDSSAITAGTATFIATGMGAVMLGGQISVANQLAISSSADSTISGIISGSGSLSLATGTLTLSNTNTYGGGTTVTGGATLIGDVNAFGSGAITLNQGSLSSTFDRLGNALFVDTGGGSVIASTNLGGPISGSGALHLAPGANGGIILGGDNSAFSGQLFVDSGEITASHTNALSALSAVNVAAGATLDIEYVSQSVGSLSGGGMVLSEVPEGSIGLTAGSLGTSTTFSGEISNGASTSVALAKVGAGALTLTGANTYTGFTTVTAGALVVDGPGTIASATTVTSAGSGASTTYGLLGGTGAVGSVSVMMGATLSPGDYGAGASSVGHLSAGAITLAAGAHFAEQLGGAMGFDQVTASGGVHLGGASLDLTVLNGFTPTSGSSYNILHLTGGAILDGTQFAQGSSVTTSDGYTYAISYSSTDVTLSYTAPAPPPPPAPSGPPAGSHVLTLGADPYQAGNGGEIVYGEGGSDTILGGTGNDTLSAGGYPGQATQGSASDHTLIEGGSGADSIVGGVGHDLLLGQMGNDHITVVAGSQGASVYGGQGDDVIDASASNAPNYLSGDIGNDTIMSGAGFETVLGGAGDDVIVGGSSAGVGSLQLLFGNQGNDHISYAGAGSVEIFGGQDDDTLSVTTSGQGQTHYLFGNLGNDTLTASGGFNSLYGGQGDDVVQASGAGHNYLSGDIGDDTVTASVGGFDTVRGGPGADTITLSAHASNAGDTVLMGAGESTAAQGAAETNLDHIAGFNFASDHIVVIGHAAGTASNVTTYMDGAANGSEAAAFASAYTYAYGDGTTAHTAHVGATEYLAVSESYGGTNAVYVFTADHTAIAFTGVTAGSFQAGAIVGG